MAFNAILFLCLLPLLPVVITSRSRILPIEPRYPPPIEENTERGVYSIVAPGKIIPNSTYYLTISTKDGETDTSVTAVISSDGKEEIKVNELLNRKETKIVKIPIGNLKPDKTYTLSVHGSGGFKFNHSSELHMQEKQVSIFIQTDKAMYKPSKTVKFRTVVVNEELRPIKSNTPVITTIKDASGNIIKKFSTKTPPNGILSQELKLSDQPVLGDWTISVNVSNKKIEKKFTVAEYILPSFNVDIKLPPFVICNSLKFVASVKAYYTYGKGVKGKMVFKIIDGFSSWFNGTFSKRVRYVLQSEIDGERDVEIETENFAAECSRHNNKIDFEVSVVDKLTGKSYNKTKSLQLYDQKYKFQLLKTQKYKSGFDYVNFLKISYPDGTPVPNSDKPLKIRYGFGYSRYRRDGSKIFETVPVNGIAKIILDTKFISAPIAIHTDTTDNQKPQGIWYPYPREENSVISIDATYDGFDSTVGTVYEDKDECYTDFHIFNEEFEKTYKVGDEITFEVTTDKTMHNFVYELVSRKGVILAQSFEEPITQIVSFTLNVTRKFVPKANVVIHFFCNQKIIDKSLTINVDGLFTNKPHIQTNTTETHPGKMVKLNIESKPHSSVAIFGYDQRSALLKSGNDIENEVVVSQVSKQLGCKGSEHFSSCATSSGHWYHWHHSSRNNFRESGLIHFTNIRNEPVFYPWRHRLNMGRITGGARGRGRYAPMAMAANVDTLNAPTPPRDADIAYSERTSAKSFTRNSPKSESRLTKNAAEVSKRQHFPETWLFEIVDTNDSGKASIIRKIPDSITSWFVTSFAINKRDGFGLMESASIIKVFRPFFIKLSLPYSVIRGETVSVPVTVYNYMNNAQVTSVTLDNRGDFDFVVAENEVNEVSFSTESKTKTLTLPANDGVSFSFLIKPRKVGYLNIQITAISDSASDAVSEKLLVKPEGQTIYKNNAILINLKDNKKVEEVVNIGVPENIVPDSERVVVTAIGDILGPAINNLDDLLRMPYGCGEQNMVNLVPNIVILDYLNKAGKLTEKIKTKAISHIETGYQRELTYKHDDGSYSAFGKSDSHGSTWLTAYVHKSFMQAKDYVNIDEKITDQSMKFLLSVQNEDGSFQENGKVLHTAMQSKSGENSVSLTAYVYIALNTNAKHSNEVKEKLKKSEDYLFKHMEKATDMYEIMIISYALQLHNSSSRDLVLKKLQGVSQMDPAQTNDDAVSSAAVEMSSYGLMTIMLKNDIPAALPVVRYLVSKQNSKGGYCSTQDTVIALQALGSFAGHVLNVNPSLKIEVKSDQSDDSDGILEVNPENSIVLQEVRLSPKTRKVTLKAIGEGSAIMQVSWKYNIAKVTEKPSFSIKNNVDNSAPENTLSMTVALKYLNGNASGMAVMEATLPSGYVADVEYLHDLKKSGVKRVETKNENTVIVVYFDEITEKTTTVKLLAIRKVKLANLKPVPITVYDYYDKSKSATIFYTARQSSICDICEGDNCGKSCSGEDQSDKLSE